MSINQKGNFLLIVGILILLVVVGGGAYYLGSQNKATIPAEVPPVIQTPIPSASASSATIIQPVASTVGWKTFQNKDFSVEYPTSTSKLIRVECPPPEDSYFFLTVGTEDRKAESCARDSQFPIEIVVSEQRLNEPVDGEYFKVRQENITIAGIPARKYTSERIQGMGPEWSLEIFANKNNKTFRLYVQETVDQDKEQLISLFNQILSTFKFAN